MKRRIIFLVPSLAFVFAWFLVFAPSTVEASVVDDAKKYCTTAEQGDMDDRLVSSCYSGYLRAKKVEAGQASDKKEDYCRKTPGIDYAACLGGWDAATKNTSPGSEEAVQSGQVTTICGYYSGDEFNSCKQGVEGQAAGKSQSDACRGAKDQEKCKNGWSAGKNRISASQITEAAKKACQDKKNDVKDACIVGFLSGSGGGSDNGVCNSYSGESKTACQEAFGAAGATGSENSDDSPTCRADGWDLNWILCPIFNATAGMADWLFAQVVEPLLRSTPISTDPSDPSYRAWSNFRIYGNIFLVIALLVIVFGQSIGGGLVDAYTAKKVLPRLVIATILINLSIYIVAALVDITNVVGGSLGSIMTQPLKDAGAFEITPSGVQQGTLGVGGVAAGTITAYLSGLFFTASGATALAFAGHTLMFVALFVLMPAFFGLLAAFITLVLRQALILALVLVSPVAFALYCLPNTQQYFRKWWDLLIQTLLVYPIIIVFFAVADILSVTVMNTGKNDNLVIAPLAAIISFVLQFLPLVFIPFAFRLAGGLLGRAHELMTNNQKRLQEGIKGNANNPNSLRNRVRGNVGADLARGRAQQYRSLKNWGSEGSLRRRIGGRLASGQTILGDPLQREAQLNEEARQRIFGIKDFGDDSIINARASFIDPTDGKRKTLDGKLVNEADYRAARRLHPRLSEVQAVSDYRSTKINTTEEAIEFARNFGLMAQQEGLSADEATGVFTGLAFARQNERGEFKYGKFTQDANGQFRFQAAGGSDSYTSSDGNVENSRAAGFVREQYAKRGSFEGARMLSSYFQSMGDIKKHHIDQLEHFDGLEQGGQQLTQDQLAAQAHSRGQLKQILEIQKAFDYSGQVPDPENPGQMLTRGGLSGASAETQAAFDKMKDLDKGIGAAPGPNAQHPQRAVVEQLNSEIERGQTYERENSPQHGNADTRY